MIDRQAEIKAFVPSWTQTPLKQAHEEWASYLVETKHFPDPYYFLITKYGLKSPITGKLIKDSILVRDNVEKLEAEAFKKIDDWSISAKLGTAVWISPPSANYQTDESKVVVSEIQEENGKSILFNRAIILPVDAKTILRTANNFSDDLYFSDPEELRANPIFLSPDSQHWLDILKNDFPDYFAWGMIDNGSDIAEKQRALDSAPEAISILLDGKRIQITADDIATKNDVAAAINHARSQNLIGDSPVSCPPRLASAFGMMFKSAEMLGVRVFCCECPYCKKQVEAKIYGGRIHCPNCKKSEVWTS